jgi:UDP-2-acetamido-2-deoxy-ribo-hexuluronate aminotransferase
MKFIDLKRQFEKVRPAVEGRIGDVLEHGKFILGPEVQELEQSLAGLCGVGHAIGVANGTDALMLALMTDNVGRGDAVFTSAFSFFASAEVISLVGATPIFVDIDEGSYNISPSALADSIDSVIDKGELRPRGIIAVDLFGLPADYPSIASIAAEHDILLIEDAAQSFGAELGDHMAGSFGSIAATSFFPAKPLGCFGDGGAVFTNDDSLAERIRSLRVHGKGKDKYDNVRIGMNSRLDTLQAAILLAKLDVFPDELVARNRWANEYSERLRQDFFVPEIPAEGQSAWAQYTIRSRHGTREEFMQKLADAGVPSAVYYSKPLHLQPAFADLGGHEGQCPVAERCAQSVFSLPMHPYLKPEEVDRVVKALLQ